MIWSSRIGGGMRQIKSPRRISRGSIR
uniref:Uncharacterized protein n=1 Tax=Arundo donax TaxID=35708 RepID=A0A0A8ZN63_ARUDO